MEEEEAEAPEVEDSEELQTETPEESQEKDSEEPEVELEEGTVGFASSPVDLMGDFQRKLRKQHRTPHWKMTWTTKMIRKSFLNQNQMRQWFQAQKN